MANSLGHLGLGVTNSMHLKTSDKVTNVLLAFFLEQFLETVGSKVVEELNDILLFNFLALVSLADVEVDAHINTNENVVFCGYLLHRAVEAHGVFSDKCGHLVFVAARQVAPLGAWIHHTIVCSISHAQGVNSVGDV